MFHEGKFLEPDHVDGIGPLWKPMTIERWAEREVVGTHAWRKRYWVLRRDDVLQRLMKHADNLGRATPETRSRSAALDPRGLRYGGGRDRWVLVPDLLREEQRPAERALLPFRAFGDLAVSSCRGDP